MVEWDSKKRSARKKGLGAGSHSVLDSAEESVGSKPAGHQPPSAISYGNYSGIDELRGRGRDPLHETLRTYSCMISCSYTVC